MKRIIASCLLATSAFLAPLPANALEPAAPWPQEAQARPLPRPAWIMVVPARRLSNGSLLIWDRDDPWIKTWRVPQTIAGMRTVSLFGDSEDRRNITAEAIDGMLVDSLDVVMRKYGAPAIALAVTDGRSVAMAAWVPGWSASWQPVPATEDLEQTRAQSLQVLSSMLRPDAVRPRPAIEQGGVAGAEVAILDWRKRFDGGTEFRVDVRAGPGQTVRDAVNGLMRLRGISVGIMEEDGSSARVILGRDPGSGPLENDLRALGYAVR